jgi:diguanylate cyclase (GGDEF)-like protein/PAS domain S-box-containing protein
VEFLLDIESLATEVMNNSSEAITIVRKEEETYKYVYSNSAARKLEFTDDPAGKTIDEIYGAETAAKLAALFSKVLETERAETVNEPYAALNETVSGRFKIIPLKNKQGQYQYVLILAAVQSEPRSDKTERSEHIIETICNRSKEALMFTDLDGRVSRVNGLFSDMFGWTEPELEHSLIEEMPFIPEHLKDEAKQLTLRVYKGEFIGSFSTQRCNKQHELIDVSINCVPIFNDGGDVSGFMASYRDQREQLKKDKELRESEERHRKLFELTPDPVVIYGTTEILYANQAFLKLVGAETLEQIAGTHIYRFIHPGDRSNVQERIRQMKKTGEPLKATELTVIRADGSMLTAGVHSTPITIHDTDCVLSIWRNITEQKEAESELRESRQRYKLMAQNMRDLVAVFDTNGMMAYVSPSHETMLGLPPLSLVGKNILKIVHPHDAPIITQKFRQLLKNRTETTAEVRFVHAEGYEVIVEATGSIIESDSGGLENILIVSRDIRERKRLEEQLKGLAYYDTLTGLPNRRFFEDQLDRKLSYAKRHKMKLALLYMDLDGFKEINDTLGHAAGDEILIRFSTAIDDCLKKSDVFARLGGDEFVILLSESNKQEIVRISNQIIEAVQKYCSVGAENRGIGTSIGIAMYPADGKSQEELLKCADEAMYRAKAAGKNQFMFYAASN